MCTNSMIAIKKLLQTHSKRRNFLFSNIVLTSVFFPNWQSYLSVGEVKNDHRSNVWLHSSVGRASHRYRGGHGFKSRWSPDFFQASSFQLLKLENLLRWSLFTFIYNRSKSWYELFHINFTSFHCTGRYELNKLTSLPHRYCGGHGFESRWSPDFFRLLLSNCLNWKIYCDDHSSLSSTTAVQIWII